MTYNPTAAWDRSELTRLRATVKRFEKLADQFDTIADNYEAGSTKYPTNSVTARSVAARIRATLASKETP